MAAPTTPGPDLAGFADAQRRHRGHFGEDVTFLQPVEVTFPPGTPLDPDSGEPYDPTIRPVASAQASAVVKCNVAFIARQSAGREYDATAGALGEMERTHVMLICDITDRPVIEPATSFLLRGERFAVSSSKPDALATVQRFLVYGRRE